MTDFNFLSDEGFLLVKTMYKVLKILRREKQSYLTSLQYRCGVGLSTEQFNHVVKTLAERQWFYLKQGGQGATLVVFNDQFTDITVPEVPVEEAVQ